MDVVLQDATKNYPIDFKDQTTTKGLNCSVKSIYAILGNWKQVIYR